MLTSTSDQLQLLFTQWSGNPAQQIKALPPSGSNRLYYRLSNETHQAIGAVNTAIKENETFLYLSTHFASKGLTVPQIYGISADKRCYLLEDLGDTSLLQFLQKTRQEHPSDVFSSEAKSYYQKALALLVKVQVVGSEGLDFEKCHPYPSFNSQRIQWDLQYWKYYFLKLAHIPFNEQQLEADFQTLTSYLLTAQQNYFMYRDFQSRNIMLKEGQLHLIDYQGGMKGPLQYDVISLLYQAKARIPQPIREELYQYYLEQLGQHLSIDQSSFTQHYQAYLLIRLLQVLGAYGFRGIYEKKAHFLTSIPPALANIRWYLNHIQLPIELPELFRCLQALVDDQQFKAYETTDTSEKLTVHIRSFSYRKGIPIDLSGNGGGHVFDCRSIFNPGRFEPYKKLTGRDQPVIEFLETQSNIQAFLEPVYAIVDRSVANYVARNFKHLMVCFGCTGGQHRSVYSADHLAQHLQEKYDIVIDLEHVEQERKNWIN